ncbi:MAG: FAD-dependent oxidoreductase, partial [Oscillospiraceae bacterium]|jgi:thioredoxin reductase|nr:FAD-dependent oxidoreductase [Oscillospiraceae bacterium]
VPGIENAVWAPVYTDDAGDARLAIIGAGAVGLECAIELARAGRSVTVWEMAATHSLGADMSPLGGGDDILKMCADAGVVINYNARLAAIDGDTATFAGTGENAAAVTLKNVRVLLAAGMTPLTALAQTFRAAAPNTEVYLAGDCREVGDIRDATRGAFEICRQI